MICVACMVNMFINVLGRNHGILVDNYLTMYLFTTVPIYRHSVLKGQFTVNRATPGYYSDMICCFTLTGPHFLFFYMILLIMKLSSLLSEELEILLHDLL